MRKNKIEKMNENLRQQSSGGGCDGRAIGVGGGGGGGGRGYDNLDGGGGAARRRTLLESGRPERELLARHL